MNTDSSPLTSRVLFLSVAVLVGTVLFAGTVHAAAPSSAPATALSTAPGLNKLQCFDGTTDGGFGGVCTLTGKGAKGPATLNNTDSNPAGSYSGVYIIDSTLFGQPLNKITQLSYNYTGSITPGPGDLSLNLPIDTNGDGTTEAYAFIDAAYCPGVGGSVNVITDPNCGIYYGGVTFYANWAAFIAAYPGAKVATDNYMFIIAERTATEGPAFWTVSNVKLGKGGR